MAEYQETLDPKPNEDVTNDQENKAVKTALKLIKDNFNNKRERDSINETLKDMVEAGFEVKEPNGTRKINVKKLYQAFWKTMQRVKLLDFTLHASQRPEWIEKLTTDGVSTVLRKGGYVSMFRDKGGLFPVGFGYGYSFGVFGTQQKGFPFKFFPLDNTNVYVDTRATAMRSGSKPVKKCCVIQSMTWAEFIKQWPKFEEKAGIGKIPRNTVLGELDQDISQTFSDDDVIEVAYYYDISNMNYTIFAGAACTVIEEYNDKDYPFVFNNPDSGEEEPYIPVIHFKCMPSFEGFYDHGIFEAIYDLSVLYNRILNQQSNHTVDGADPIAFFSVPQGGASEIFQKMDMAARMRAQGKRPVVALEYDPSQPNAGRIGAESLQVQSLVNEAQIMFDLIDREIKRLGINLDELESGDVTATQILADEENANRFVKQVMEMNASEFEFIIRVVLDQIPKVIKKSDKTPLQMTTTVRVEEGDETFEIRADGFTLGQIADELRNHDYFVKVNARSGADNSKLRAAQIARVLQITPQGSPAQFSLTKKFAEANDIDEPLEAFGGQPSAPQEIPEAIPSETDPQSFNPRQAEQVSLV